MGGIASLTTTRSSRKPAPAKEIWAYGLRNPHRLTWAVDARNAANNRLIANTVGLHTWETVNIIRRGANFGYPLREGNEQLNADNRTTALPPVDRIPVRVTDAATSETVTPRYPVVQYGHVAAGGVGANWDSRWRCRFGKIA
jgi:glucose/arabinose dehydrogenase